MTRTARIANLLTVVLPPLIILACIVVKGAFRGLLHAHVGWLLTEHGRADRAKYARDLVEDRGMRIVDKGFVGWVLLGLAASAALAGSSPAPTPARSPVCCGAASSASSSCTT
jgi:hypothetical protein